MKLIVVRPENIDLAWPDVEKYIAQGLEHADHKYNLNDVKEMLHSQSLNLWVVYNEEKQKAMGCALTQVLQYPQLKALSIFLLAGDDFSKMLKFMEELKEYAARIECKTIEFYGRPGWEKMLKAYNFEKIHTVMRLNL
jgi:hypothetical protein